MAPVARSGSWRWLACLAGVALSGCYTYAYTPVTPAPGSYVMLDLNDAGRAQLGDRIGSGILSVEGSLTEASDSLYTLRVMRTIGIRGESVKWAGEPVLISRQQVGVVRERHLSVGRTAAFTGSLALAVGAFIASRGLFGFGGQDNSGDPPGQGEQ